MVNETQMDGDIWWSISFANDGGPLIVLTRELLSHWRGSEPHLDYEQDESDYDRTDEADGPAEAITVGPALVLSLALKKWSIQRNGCVCAQVQKCFVLVGTTVIRILKLS